MARKIQQDYETVCELWEKGNSAAKISKRLNIARQTVYNIVYPVFGKPAQRTRLARKEKTA